MADLVDLLQQILSPSDTPPPATDDSVSGTSVPSADQATPIGPGQNPDSSFQSMLYKLLSPPATSGGGIFGLAGLPNPGAGASSPADQPPADLTSGSALPAAAAGGVAPSSGGMAPPLPGTGVGAPGTPGTLSPDQVPDISKGQPINQPPGTTARPAPVVGPSGPPPAPGSRPPLTAPPAGQVPAQNPLVQFVRNALTGVARADPRAPGLTALAQGAAGAMNMKQAEDLAQRQEQEKNTNTAFEQQARASQLNTQATSAKYLDFMRAANALRSMAGAAPAGTRQGELNSAIGNVIKQVNGGMLSPDEGKKQIQQLQQQFDQQRKAAQPKPPQPGDSMGGYRFKGGDPSKPENWEKVQ